MKVMESGHFSREYGNHKNEQTDIPVAAKEDALGGYRAEAI
jgi:hypothetical protein